MDLFSLLNTNSIWLPIVLLFVSIFGSSHCLIMCVPILAYQDGNNLNYYHLGRLLSYLILATAIYYLGQKSLNNELLWLISGIVFLTYFIWISVKGSVSKGCCPKSKVKFKNVFFLGVINGLLPCGWLFLVLMLLSRKQNYIFFLLYVTIFWLGTIPVFHVLKFKGTVKKYLPAIKNKGLIKFLYFAFALYSFCLHYEGAISHTAEKEPMILCGG